MNDDQEDRLTAAIATNKVLTNSTNAPKYATTTAMVSKVTAFGSKIAEIQGTAKVQEVNRTGPAEDKGAAKEATSVQAMVVIGPIRAYAKDKKDHTLEQKVNYSKSGLEGIRDTDFPTAINIILDEANANAATYKPYGLDATMITDLSTQLATYVALETAPREGISEEASATKILKTQFSDLLDIEKTLDSMMLPFQTKDVDFFNQYTTARKIVNTGSKSKTPAPPSPPPQNP